MTRQLVFLIFEVGAPMKGDVVAIKVQPGDMVIEGQVCACMHIARYRE